MLIFGPGKLPQLGESLGRSIKEFKKGLLDDSGVKDTKDSNNTL
jgi:TatA/E family protein of Tat protein translocase